MDRIGGFCEQGRSQWEVDSVPYMEQVQHLPIGRCQLYDASGPVCLGRTVKTVTKQLAGAAVAAIGCPALDGECQAFGKRLYV